MYVSLNNQDWTSLCPVCKSSPLLYETQKGFFGLTSKEIYQCKNCMAQFLKNKEKFVLKSTQDKTNQIWTDYKDTPLSAQEWIRIANGGLSDSKQRETDLNNYFTSLRNGNIIVSENSHSPIILKKGEDHVITFHNITLKEPRSVRKTSGGFVAPRVRVAKGVSIGFGKFGASSESHDEIRDIDRGKLSLTTKRIVFTGSHKTTTIDIKKITSMKPFLDGIGINRENKERWEYFVGFPNDQVDIKVDNRSYKEPFSGLFIMSMIEGIIRGIKTPSQLTDKTTKASPVASQKSVHEDRKFSIQVDRNLNGKELEKEGDIEGAIALYEQNVAEGFAGNHPYDRLAIIYRKNKAYSEEIRVLERAIFVFENYASQDRPDVQPKLEAFKERLQKAQQLNEKISNQ